MSRKYFGTDGIRGEVGTYPINAEFVLKLGWAAGRVLGNQGNGYVLIGKDTRISGYLFESALEAGLSSAGVDIRLTGPMPTPGVAYLTRTLNASAGIVISASHNPHQDNGIKFFSSDGEKLPDEVELAIEAELDKPMETVPSERLGKAERLPDAGGRYIEFCKSTIPSRLRFNGLRVVVDCANGATYHIAPPVFEEIGCEVERIGVNPDGLNINAGVGATDTAALRAKVAETGADVGIALDGDGDRLIMVDEHGEEVDGDELLFTIAKARVDTGSSLRGPVVGTLMSNLGLEHALNKLGLDFKRADVGDRYVLEMLKQFGGILGGESSGHIICLDRTSTGDGIVSALQVLAAMKKSGRTLHELRRGMNKYPQHMINVRVGDKSALASSVTVKSAVREAETELNGRGRVLLRPSGTEPLIRVMVEGQDGEEVMRITSRLAEIVQDALS
ncbi:MAG: phosphoglucosamine mutase [Chromatiales bacterium]|nr:phosphoglucosamine mutase [Chromatiales bacterium]